MVYLIKNIVILTIIMMSSLSVSHFYTYLDYTRSVSLTYAKNIKDMNGLRLNVYQTALRAYRAALKTGRVHNKNILTVIDFSLPSNQKRLWVINLKEHKVIMKLYVSHGKGSGYIKAKRFSNKPNLKTSSLGIYITAGEYYGKHGLSEHVQGIERGVNTNANLRAIEYHSADYTTKHFVKTHGYTGRSWGCFTVSPKYSNKLIHTIHNGSVTFVYIKSEQNKVFNDLI